MGLSTVAAHLGLVVFTALTVAVVAYLVYSMLRPDAF